MNQGESNDLQRLEAPRPPMVREGVDSRVRMTMTTEGEVDYHALIPGPTRLADPNRGRGARPYTETLYFFFFFFNNRIKISYTYQKNYHRSGVHQNLYTHTESHLHIHIQQIFTFNYIFRAQNLL